MKTIHKTGVNHKILLFIGIVTVLAIHMLGINNVKVPTILYDEAGYWISAAHFAGKDWSGLTSVMSYYSYGIGLFLAIFMKIGRTPIITYQMVMLFNVTLVSLCYFCAYKICKFLFPQIKKEYWILISAVCMMFSAFIINSQIAWSEHYLACLFWLEIYLLMNIIKKPTYMKCALYSLFICYSYMVHQRAVVVILASLIIIVDLLYLKKISIRHVILILFIFITMLAMHILIKHDIQYNVWNVQNVQAVPVEANDYTSRFEILLFCIKNEGIITVLRSFVGKLFYLIISTAGICVFSYKSFLENVIKLIKSKKIDDRERLIVYTVLLFTAVMLFNVITNMEDGLTAILYSTLVYGRYMEWAIPPMLLIGFGRLISTDYSNAFLIKADLLLLLLSICIFSFYHTGNFTDRWMTSCAGGISWFYDHTKGDKKLYVFFAALMIILFLNSVFWVNKKKKAMALIIIGLYFVFMGLYVRKEMIYYTQKNNQRLIPVANTLMEAREDIPLYYVIKDVTSSANSCILILQYLMENYKMAYIQPDDLELVKGPYYLLVSDYSYERYPNYYVIENSNPTVRVLVKKDNVEIIQKFERGN